MKILVIEDDQNLGSLLSAALTANHYTVELASDGEVGLELANQWNYDLVVLDIQLPNLDGITVCRRLRSQGLTMPILVLTARNSTQDVTLGLDAGADDYVIKPCDISQLLARIRALLRRGGNRASSPVLEWGNLCLNPVSAHVTYQNQRVVLRPKEYCLLELFLRNPHRILSRTSILDHLWTIDDCPTEHAVTNLIKDLRRQLKSAGMTEDLIETVYGLGYRVKSFKGDAPVGKEAPTDSAQNQGIEKMNRIAERFKTTLEQRFDLLVRAQHALQANQLTLAQRRVAQEEAHQLAGSLGTFSYGRGSELARQIEFLLMGDADLDSQQTTRFLELLTELKQELTHSSNPAIANFLSSVQPLELQLDVTPANVLVVGTAPWLETLQPEAERHNLQFSIVADWEIALSQLTEVPPQAVMLSLDEIIPREERFALLRQLRSHFSSVPVIVIADQDNLSDRVQVARLGGIAYLPKSVSPSRMVGVIVDSIRQQVIAPTQSGPPAPKVMVVDDDATMLETLSALLEPWGVNVTTLNQPSHFWEVLTATRPDLLLLDLEMPSFNGIELCQVVRQDAEYGNLPILVVTAHTNAASMQQVFAAGADDLIYKPVVGPELVTRVLSRIERWRNFSPRATRTTDPSSILTANLQLQELATPTHAPQSLSIQQPEASLEQTLQQEWQRLLHLQQPLSLILCDLDDLKRDGDRKNNPSNPPLDPIVMALQGCIRSVRDRLFSCSPSCFAILLPETNLQGALHVAERIQRTVVQLPQPNASKGNMTLTMGITGTVPAAPQSSDTLIATANQALYAAKSRGRNTFTLFPVVS